MWLKNLQWEHYHGLFWWALHAIEIILIRESQRETICTQREEKTMWRHRQRQQWCGHKPLTACSPQKLQQVREAFSPRASKGSVALPNPWFHTPGLLSMREHLSVVSNHPVCVICYSSHRKWVHPSSPLLLPNPLPAPSPICSPPLSCDLPVWSSPGSHFLSCTF